MRFSVIYTFDMPRHYSVKWAMPSQRHLWQQTEDDEQAELDHLGDDWQNHKHRKLVAVLSKEQFLQFLSDTGLFPEEIETMGSLGAPGFDFGIAPAISFRSENAYDPVFQDAYVTPIPDTRPPWNDHDFDRIKRALLSQFGYSGNGYWYEA